MGHCINVHRSLKCVLMKIKHLFKLHPPFILVLMQLRRFRIKILRNNFVCHWELIFKRDLKLIFPKTLLVEMRSREYLFKKLKKVGKHLATKPKLLIFHLSFFFFALSRGRNVLIYVNMVKQRNNLFE